MANGPVPIDDPRRRRTVPSPAPSASPRVRVNPDLGQGPTVSEIVRRARELELSEREILMRDPGAIRQRAGVGAGAPTNPDRELLEPQLRGRPGEITEGAAVVMGRVVGEVALAAGTSGGSLPIRALVSVAGVAGIEALFAEDGHRAEAAIEGAVIGGTFEAVASSVGPIGRGAVRLGRRIRRSPATSAARSVFRNEQMRAIAQAETVTGAQASMAQNADSEFLTRVETFVETSMGGRPLRELREENIAAIRASFLEHVDDVPNPQGLDLDVAVNEAIDGRLDIARGQAATFFREVFDGVNGAARYGPASPRVPGAGGPRFKPRVPKAEVTKQLVEERLGLENLRDETYVRVLREMQDGPDAVTFEQMQRWRSDLFAYSNSFGQANQVPVRIERQSRKMAAALGERMQATASAAGRLEEYRLANRIWAEEVRGVYSTAMLRRIVREEPTKAIEQLLRNGTAEGVTHLRNAIGIGRDIPGLSEGANAAARAEAGEAWRRVQGAWLYQAIRASGAERVVRRGVEAGADPLGRQGIVTSLTDPDGNKLLQQLLRPGDERAAFVQQLFPDNESRRLYRETIQFAETLRFFQNTPKGGSIALKLAQTEVLVSVAIGGGVLLAGGDASNSLGAASGALMTLTIGERAAAKIFASPRWMHAATQAFQSQPGGSRSRRALLMMGLEVLRETAAGEILHSQAEQLVNATASSLGLSGDQVVAAAKSNPATYIGAAKPVVLDRSALEDIR